MEQESSGVDFSSLTKADAYTILAGQLESLLTGESDRIANAANTAALLYEALPDVNWAGFYFLKENELVVGPFQGRPACVHIALGHGVCGTAAAEMRTQVIDDVHAFPGHITCDIASKAEIVVPLILNESLIGVLDIDSPVKSRFDGEDRKGIERLAKTYVDSLNEEVTGDE